MVIVTKSAVGGVLKGGSKGPYVDSILNVRVSHMMPSTAV